MSEASDLYKRDFHAWTQDQAALLRAWPEALRPNALDIANLAEEIESLGRSERNAVESLLLQIMLHLLKLQQHPDQTAPRHWQAEIDTFRDQLVGVSFRDSPSLRAHRQEIAVQAWPRAKRRFERDLARDGVRLDQRIPTECPFDLDTQVLAEDWFPPPAAA